MAARKKQQVLLRIDPKIHEKMKIIADYNKRTMSLQAE